MKKKLCSPTELVVLPIFFQYIHNLMANTIERTLNLFVF